MEPIQLVDVLRFAQYTNSHKTTQGCASATALMDHMQIRMSECVFLSVQQPPTFMASQSITPVFIDAHPTPISTLKIRQGSACPAALSINQHSQIASPEDVSSPAQYLISPTLTTIHADARRTAPTIPELTQQPMRITQPLPAFQSAHRYPSTMLIFRLELGCVFRSAQTILILVYTLTIPQESAR